MKTRYLMPFLLLFTILVSCTEKITKYYYDTGELKEENIFVKKSDTANFMQIKYYKSGQMKSKGPISNGFRNGFWEEWYGDGSIKWHGNYSNGERLTLFTNPVMKIVWEKNEIKAGQRNRVRLVANGIHPDDMAISSTNGVIEVSKSESYDYDLIPQKKGLIRIGGCIFVDTIGFVTIGEYVVQ